jgi:hypothetical protein
MRRIGVLGAALLALPLWAQTAENSKVRAFLRFTMDEKPAEIVRLIGKPGRVDDTSRNFQSWMYDAADDEDHDDNLPPAYIICLRNGDQQIMSITRNYDEPQDVEALFPAGSASVYHWPAKEAPQFSVRLRSLPGEKLVLAMGTSQAGQKTTQLILIRRSALPQFMPWLAEQLTAQAPPR